MKDYTVRIHYTTYVDVQVKANSEEEAIRIAAEESCSSQYDQQFIDNVQDDTDLDAEIIDE